MAILDLKYYTGTDQYVDSEEDLLLSYYRGETKIENPQDNLFFLTTRERENILAWYPFQNKDVLEIGCGCGCITGILCEHNKKVVSVDQSKKRAQITFERHKDKGNLEIYAGNIEEIPFQQKFDYIVLIGVLEYAKRFFSHAPEDEYFLKLIRNLLKPDGVLLIAIENRYGIKYFAGANEDHLGKQYISLTGYEKTDIVTYGKQELVNILNKCGYSKTKFYYPFPDYKLPSIIYSDDRLPTINEAALIPIFTYGNPVNFSIHDALIGIIENNQFDFFSNSFLVEAGTDESCFSDIIYAKYQPKRNSSYQIISLETKDKQFIKRPRIQDECKHLNKYESIHSKLRSIGIEISNVYKSKTRDEWFSEYINGKTVSELVNEEGKRKGKAGIQNEIQKLVNYFYSLSDYIVIDNPIIDELVSVYKQQPTYVLKYSLLDLNASNLIFANDKYILIDQEWEDYRQLPTDYAIMNSIGYIYSTCPIVRNNYLLSELMEEYGITKDKAIVLEKISKVFFVNDNSILDVEKCTIFDQLNHYDIVHTYYKDMDIKYSELYEHAKKLEEQLYCKNKEVEHLSAHYNRVVRQIEQMEVQLREKNEQLADLSQNYQRVVDNILFLENQLKERNQQVAHLSENYNRVIGLLKNLEQ